MLNLKDVIYRDIDNNGVSYTIYYMGECIGSFLEDDIELDKYRRAGLKVVDGLDNRE